MHLLELETRSDFIRKKLELKDWDDQAAEHYCSSSLCLDRAWLHWLLCREWNSDKAKDSFHFGKKFSHGFIRHTRFMNISCQSDIYTSKKKNSFTNDMYFPFLFFSAVKDGDVGHIYVFLVQIVTRFQENIFHRCSGGRRRWGRWGWGGGRRRSPPRSHTARPYQNSGAYISETDILWQSIYKSQKCLEGRHHVPSGTSHWTVSIFSLEQYLKFSIYGIGFTNQRKRVEGRHHIATLHWSIVSFFRNIRNLFAIVKDSQKLNPSVAFQRKRIKFYQMLSVEMSLE